jgi:chemotaxis protein MotB
MAKRVIQEEAVNRDRWMVSYADFMTLLLSFFVVMYSVSQVNDDKYRVLTRTMEEAFKVPETAIDPIQVGDPVTAVNPGVVRDSVQSPEQQPTSGQAPEQEQRATTSEPQLPEEFRRISREVEQKFSDLIAKDLVSVQGNEEWLAIELKSSLLFQSGEAEPGVDAAPIMEALADTVRDGGLPVRVEGFTDDQPIASEVYPSNWELSSARAASIVKMLADNGVAANRLAAIGYAEFQPVAPNDSEEGRAANRRVVLMISRAARLRPDIRPAAPVMPAPVARAAPAAAAGASGTSGVDAGGSEPGKVVAVELEGGGLLYTSEAAGSATGTAPQRVPPPGPGN